MIQLAFALGKTVDELEQSDGYWIERMLVDMQARGIASAPNEQEFFRKLLKLRNDGD